MNDKHQESKNVYHTIFFAFFLGTLMGASVMTYLVWTGPVAVRDAVILELSDKVIDHARRLDLCNLNPT